MGDACILAKKMNSEHLLTLDTENLSKEVLIADTSILNNEINYKCKISLDQMLDEIIYAVQENHQVCN